jgi:hypothetical protein
MTRFVPALLLLSIVALGLFLIQPRYLEVSLPVAAHKGGGDFWWENQYAQLHFADAKGAWNVHRRVGTAYSDWHGWQSVDEAFAYFDRVLAAQGWMVAGTLHRDDPALPESRLLPAANRRSYRREGDSDAYTHVAIWPIGGKVAGFHVVVVTARPSWLHMLAKGFD